MIVFNYNNLDEFLNKLPSMIGNEVFIQYLEPEPNPELSSNQHKVILQFLGTFPPPQNQLTILHQCKLIIKDSSHKKEIVKKLKDALNQLDEIHVVEGYINEIFMSIS